MFDRARSCLFLALLVPILFGISILTFLPPVLVSSSTNPLAELLARARRGPMPLVSSPMPHLVLREPPKKLSAAAAPIVVPDISGRPAILHTVRPGDSLGAIADHYLPRTIFMTTGELEAAIRQANPSWTGNHFHPGQEVVIPGVETAPIVEHPVPMAKDAEVGAIYLTGIMAGSPRGLEIIRRWHDLGGNAVVFDIKDFDGKVSVAFDHPLAPKPRRPYIRSLPKLLRYLHGMGLHTIARITLFRDEYMATQQPELAVRSRRAKGPWRENGKLTWADPSRLEVQDYNLALAKQAGESGADEIQFDYVRFPAEGNQEDAQFAYETEHPGWTRSKVIAEFLRRAYAELHPLGVLVSVDVFGVMAWQRPIDLAHTGQDIPEMARHCDVLSPMIYPSHFFGMDGYAKPGDAPEHFINESMDRFRAVTADTGVVLRPWLQAFGWRTKTYSPEYIHTQVALAKEKGGIGYLFWNARNDYSVPFRAISLLGSGISKLPPRERPAASTSGAEPPAAPKTKTALRAAQTAPKSPPPSSLPVDRRHGDAATAE